ncbi:MAG: ribbon-helix-helix domain-containing protein [Pseudomonadota bacterium]
MPQATRKHSVTLDGHRTSISLEDPFWEALNEIALQQDQSVTRLIVKIDRERVSESMPLSSAIRIFVLEYYRKS